MNSSRHLTLPATAADLGIAGTPAPSQASREEATSLVLNRLRERLHGLLPLVPGDLPTEATVRLEDEISPGVLDSFCAWLVDLTGLDGHGRPPAEVLRAGSRRPLAPLATLKRALREAEARYDELIAELTPLLAATTLSRRRGAAAFPPGTLEGALDCLRTGDRVRNLRIRLGILSEAVPARVIAAGRSRGMDQRALRRLAREARRTVDLL